jgi:hypothetical protein
MNTSVVYYHYYLKITVLHNDEWWGTILPMLSMLSQSYQGRGSQSL